jgi:peptidoglycan hydrolase CwlO-like protein
MDASAMQVELREHDRRISSLHRSVGGIATDVGQHKTDIASLRLEVQGAREDIGELRKEMQKVRWGLWAAAGTFMMFFVASASLLIQAVGG